MPSPHDCTKGRPADCVDLVTRIRAGDEEADLRLEDIFQGGIGDHDQRPTATRWGCREPALRFPIPADCHIILGASAWSRDLRPSTRVCSPEKQMSDAK